MQYVIIRSKSAGVFFGVIKNQEGQMVVLNDARRLWYWDGAATLSELSIRGVRRPENCKFPDPVIEMTIFEVIEIIQCTPDAVASINGVAPWRT